MPGGLDEIYPKSNERLAEWIIECGGCLISEYEPGIKPQKYTFAKRDRLQSALSQAVLVIEVELESGTMHTVDAALRQERRMAVYANEIAFRTGNKFAKEKGADSIFDEQSLREFYMNLENEIVYEQMTLNL